MRLGGLEGRVLRFGMELNLGIGMGRVLGIGLAEEDVGFWWWLAHFLWMLNNLRIVAAFCKRRRVLPFCSSTVQLAVCG